MVVQVVHEKFPHAWVGGQLFKKALNKDRIETLKRKDIIGYS